MQQVSRGRELLVCLDEALVAQTWFLFRTGSTPFHSKLGARASLAWSSFSPRSSARGFVSDLRSGEPVPSCHTVQGSRLRVGSIA